MYYNLSSEKEVIILELIKGIEAFISITSVLIFENIWPILYNFQIIKPLIDGKSEILLKSY